MNIKIFLITGAIAVSSICANAQTIPDYPVAMQLMRITQKIGLPVDSAAVYLMDYTKVENTQPNQTVYKSKTGTVYISFEKDEKGRISLIKCIMPATFITTAEEALMLMDMKISGAEGEPGYVAFATPKYAAFLNPQIRPDYLSLVMMPVGK